VINYNFLDSLYAVFANAAKQKILKLGERMDLEKKLTASWKASRSIKLKKIRSESKIIKVALRPKLKLQLNWEGMIWK